MNADKILDALTDIRDDYIQDIEAAPVRRRRRFRALSVMAAVLALCLVLTVPVLASPALRNYIYAGELFDLHDILYAVSPELAQSLKPVALTCEDNGIVMEVVSAAVDGDTANIYIAIQDLEGDRIDGTTDLFDSYNIRTPFDNSGGCRFVSYDEASHTATFLIQITQWDGQDITGNKITFSVRQLLSQKQEIFGPLDVDLSAASADPATQSDVEIRGGGGPFFEYAETEALFLVPGEALYSPGDGAAVTAMGYVNGKLHLQIHYDDILALDNHGYLYLTDDTGNECLPDYAECFWDDAHTGSYEEYVFDLTPEQAAQYTLNGHFWLNPIQINGDWEVTFPLE